MVLVFLLVLDTLSAVAGGWRPEGTVEGAGTGGLVVLVLSDGATSGEPLQQSRRSLDVHCEHNSFGQPGGYRGRTVLNLVSL